MSTFSDSLASGGAGSILGAGNSLLNFGFDQLSGSLNAKRQYKYQKKLMQQQYDYNIKAADHTFDNNLKAWNMENEYNLPVNQMQRFDDAGLNPQLIYGNSTTGASLSGGQASGVGLPSSSARSSSGFDVIPAIQAIQSIIMGQKQMQVMEEDIQLKRALAGEATARTLESGSRRIGYDLKRQVDTFKFDLLKQTRDLTINRMNQEFELSKHKVDYMKAFASIRKKEASDYTKTGVRPGDNIFIRLIPMVLDRLQRLGILTLAPKSTFNK